MKRFLIICVSMILLFATACGQTDSGAPDATASPTGPGPTPSIDPSAPIPTDAAVAELVRNDFDFLLKELKANYPFADSINESLWKQDADYMVQQMSEAGMEHSVYLQAIGAVLADAVSMRVNLGPVGLGEYEYYLGEEFPYSNKAQFESLANSAEAKEFYGALLAQQGGVGEPIISVGNIETHLVMDGKTAYVRIRQFGSQIDDGDRDALLSFLRSIADAESIVIDIRGNSGNCPPEKWEMLVGLLTKGSSVSQKRMFVRDGDTVKAANNNFEAFDNVTFTPVGEASLPSAVDPSVKSLSAYVKTIQTAIEPAEDGLKFEGKIYLLTDAGTRGQMDAFAQHAAESGFAELIGGATGGLGVMGEEFACVKLPSGVLVRYAAEYGINPDGSDNLRGGVAPHTAAGDKDAFEAAIALIDPAADSTEIARSVKPVNPIITIEMDNGGVITAELYPDIAPNTVANFVTLIQSGFYDGTIFHRVIPNFVIQGGDPDGTGMGGPGYSIKGEFASNGFSNSLKHERGVLSMARSGHPDSAGSQFFIMHGAAANLDGDYAAFGKVLTGMDVVDEIVNAPRGQNDRPDTPSVMKKVTVETGGVEYSVEKLTGIR